MTRLPTHMTVRGGKWGWNDENGVDVIDENVLRLRRFAAGWNDEKDGDVNDETMTTPMTVWGDERVGRRRGWRECTGAYDGVLRRLSWMNADVVSSREPTAETSRRQWGRRRRSAGRQRWRREQCVGDDEFRARRWRRRAVHHGFESDFIIFPSVSASGCVVVICLDFCLRRSTYISDDDGGSVLQEHRRRCSLMSVWIDCSIRY